MKNIAADSLIELRRSYLQVEEIFHEFGPAPQAPQRRGVVAAVVRNPYAGRYVQDILPMMQALEPLGIDLARQLLAALGGDIESVQAYGKGAIVGSAGELEHGALWHVPGGYSMREVLGWKKSANTSSLEKGGNALAIVPSTKKVGPAGCSIDIPLTHLNASYVRSHFDAFEVRVPGAPRADEMVVILAMGCGPRVHARVGGLQVSDISRWDGQR
jgi:Amino acid synthesis